MPDSNILLLPIKGGLYGGVSVGGLCGGSLYFYYSDLMKIMIVLCGGSLWGVSVNVFYLSFRTSEDPTRFKTISFLPLGEPNIDTACRTKSPLAGVAIPPNFDLGVLGYLPM